MEGGGGGGGEGEVGQEEETHFQLVEGGLHEPEPEAGPVWSPMRHEEVAVHQPQAV